MPHSLRERTFASISRMPVVRKSPYAIAYTSHFRKDLVDAIVRNRLWTLTVNNEEERNYGAIIRSSYLRKKACVERKGWKLHRLWGRTPFEEALAPSCVPHFISLNRLARTISTVWHQHTKCVEDTTVHNFPPFSETRFASYYAPLHAGRQSGTAHEPTAPGLDLSSSR